MTTKQLESLVAGVKKPDLLEDEIKLLLNKEDVCIKPIPKPRSVAQRYVKSVAQPDLQKVAQIKSKVVAQEVAQVLWVAQVVNKKVAQHKSNVVAQDKSQVVAQHTKSFRILRVKDSKELLVDKYVNELKVQISQIQGVENRKRFIRDIGWGVMGEKRGKKYYLFGAKKISGRKYKLYVGNATN